jgi:hypothetical protein
MAAILQITVATRTASQVKATMAVLDPSFDKANYGRGSVRDFLTPSRSSSAYGWPLRRRHHPCTD